MERRDNTGTAEDRRADGRDDISTARPSAPLNPHATAALHEQPPPAPSTASRAAATAAANDKRNGGFVGGGEGCAEGVAKDFVEKFVPSAYEALENQGKHETLTNLMRRRWEALVECVEREGGLQCCRRLAWVMGEEGGLEVVVVDGLAVDALAEEGVEVVVVDAAAAVAAAA